LPEPDGLVRLPNGGIGVAEQARARQDNDCEGAGTKGLWHAGSSRRRALVSAELGPIS
jgi:hypothetical protein